MARKQEVTIVILQVKLFRVNIFFLVLQSNSRCRVSSEKNDTSLFSTVNKLKILFKIIGAYVQRFEKLIRQVYVTLVADKSIHLKRTTHRANKIYTE